MRRSRRTISRRRSLRAGEMSCRAGMQSIRQLVYAFYTKGFSFGKFMRQHPDFKKNLVDLLIGNVFYDEVDEIFGPMGKMVELPEKMPLAQPAGIKR